MNDPRFDLYFELLPLLDKDVDELYETDLYNFFMTIQNKLRNTKDRLTKDPPNPPGGFKDCGQDSDS